MRRSGIALLLVLLLPATVAAALVQVRLELSFFYPPNPCMENELHDATLEGVARLYFQSERAGAPAEVGAWASPALACSDRAGSEQAIDLRGDGALFAAFAGSLADSTTFRVYAMEDALAPMPASAPLIEIGAFSAGAFAATGAPQWPLLAFASPGQQIGTLGVRVVSEPGSGALLATSLLLLAASVHRRSRVQRLSPAAPSPGDCHDSTRRQARNRA
jgi:hypothetical protein